MCFLAHYYFIHQLNINFLHLRPNIPQREVQTAAKNLRLFLHFFMGIQIQKFGKLRTSLFIESLKLKTPKLM